MFVEDRDAEVEFFFGDDQRRSDDEVADPGLDADAVREHLRGDLIDEECGLAVDFLGVGVEGFLGVAVLDEVDSPKETFATDIADAGVFGFELVELGFDVRS